MTILQLTAEESAPFERLMSAPEDESFWQTVQALGLDPATDFDGVDFAEIDLSDVPPGVAFVGAMNAVYSPAPADEGAPSPCFVRESE
jgi:hypothetical protein